MSIAQRLYTVGITEASLKFAWQFRDLKIEKKRTNLRMLLLLMP